MNIAVIIERFNPQAGGAERSTAELVREMLRRGHHITVLTGKGSAGQVPADPPAGVLTLRTSPMGAPKGSLRLRYFRRWAMREIAAGGFDASLSVTSGVPATVVEPRAGLIADIQSRSIAWRSGPLTRSIARLALFFNLRQRTLLALERRTFRDPAVRFVACISLMMKERTALHYPAVADRLVHVPNAVDPVRASAREIAAWRSDLREKWQAAETQTLFLFPGLDSRRKGLGPLLHALALLRRDHPETSFLLLLAGRVHRSHERLIRTLDLAGHVRDIGFHKDLRPCYAAADVTVLPTYYDSFGRVIIESLLMGRPAITTAFAGAAELVQPPTGEHVRGRVVKDPDDRAALAQALFELCDPEERRRCVPAPLENLVNTPSRHVDKLLDLLTPQTRPSA